MLLALRDIGPADAASVGGKALGLAALARMGAPVPPTLVLGVQAMQAALDGAGLRARLEAGGDPGLHAEIMALELPARLRAALQEVGRRLGPSLAVRSSAIGEDGAVQSHAGQLETVLGVAPGPALERAICRCWASVAAPRAVAYRGGGPLPLVGVVLQAMLQPRCAGVMFTVNPASGSWRELTVEAAWGLGEGVVSGQLVPEWSRVSRPPPISGLLGRLAARAKLSVLERQSAVQPEALAVVDCEVQRVPVADDRVSAVKLDDGALRRLCRLGLRVEAAAGCPQDIEWAQLENGDFVLLQTRPISARAAAPPAAGVVWTRRFIGERWTEPATPLGWSLMAAQLNHFVAYPALSRSHLGGAPALRLHRFAPYINASVFRHLAFKLPGLAPPRFLVELLPPAEERAWLSALGRAPSFGVYAAILKETVQERRWRRFRWSPLHNPDQWEAWAAAFRAELPALLPATLDRAGALALHRRCGALVRGYIEVHICSLLYANITYEAATAALEAQGRGDEAPRVLRPTAESWTVRTNRALRELGLGARSLEDFLAEFGHRASSSWEIFSPRWRERPSLPLALAALAARGPDPSAEAAAQRAEADAIEAELPAPLRAGVRLARRYLLLREDQRFVFDQLLWAHKRALLALEDSLGLPVRFLENIELEGLLDGGLSHASAATLCAARSAAWEAEVRARADGDEPPIVLAEGGSAEEAHGGRLSGLGISAGQVRGVARVLRGPEEAARLRPGDILVARAADPGWTPLFLTAGGVVLEQGGMLSHGAVVAREYGLPAVVNVEAATTRIADGQAITVDGHRGLVFLC